jgi:hypothetical protein
MERLARLVPVTMPAHPAGLVLVLHGGSARRDGKPVSSAQPPVLLMLPVARAIGRAGQGDLAVFRLLNSHRGWNRQQTPVDDVDWALGEAWRRLGGEVPGCLVGHSIGGRAALLAAGHPGVVSAVALAPWLYSSDDADVSGRRILIVHGSRDRIADPAKSAAAARNLASSAEAVGYVLVDGGTHAMLRRHRRFTSLAADFAAATVLGRSNGGLVSRVLDGQQFLEV